MARYPRAEQTFFPDRAKVFRCPADLNPVAQKLWRQLAPELLAAGILSKIDEPAFRSLCQCYGLAQAAAAEVERDGCTFTTKSGEIKKHPACGIHKSNIDSFIKLCGLFGLSPATRDRISGQPTNAEDQASEFFLNEAHKK